MPRKEYLQDASTDSEQYNEVLEILQHGHLDSTFSSKWKPAKIQLIKNKALHTDYEEKQQDFLIRGRKEEELVERWGYMIENNTASLELICSIGFQAKDSEYNALGYNRMGIYCCKNSDVCLQHALIKHSGAQVMRMLVCKYIAGRSTKAIPRVASAAEFIEPTQGFDCHESVIPPQPNDSLQNQFDRSQVYIYEITKLLQPTAHPRQLLPYALISFTSGGTYLPAIDAEPSMADKLSTNPRLQQIVHQINTKDDASTSSSSPDPPAPPSDSPGVSTKQPPGGYIQLSPATSLQLLSSASAKPLAQQPPLPSSALAAAAAAAAPLMLRGSAYSDLLASAAPQHHHQPHHQLYGTNLCAAAAAASPAGLYMPHNMNAAAYMSYGQKLNAAAAAAAAAATPSLYPPRLLFGGTPGAATMQHAMQPTMLQAQPTLLYAQPGLKRMLPEQYSLQAAVAEKRVKYC